MRCFLFTLFLLFFPVFCQASQTKSKVLTDSNLMVEDESQVFVFPSSASRFKNKMSIQVNGEKPEENPIYSGQIIYQLNDNFFLATVLSDQREAPDFPDQEIKYPDKKYHFLLSHKNNKREMAAQIYFGLSRNAKEEKEGKEKLKETSINRGSFLMGIGLGFSKYFKTFQYDLSLKLQLARDYDEKYNEKLKEYIDSDGNLNKDEFLFQIVGRSRKRLSHQKHLLILGSLSYAQGGKKVGFIDLESGEENDLFIDFSGTLLVTRLGIGLEESFANESFKLYFLSDLSYLKKSIKTDNLIKELFDLQDFSTFTLPSLTLGTEYRVLSWLHLFGHVRKDFNITLEETSSENKNDIKNSGSTSSIKIPDGSFSSRLGFSFIYDILKMDFSLHSDLFKRDKGLGIVNGKGGNIVGQTTISLDWDKLSL